MFICVGCEVDRNISVELAHQSLGDADVLFLDVRTRQEFVNEGRIKNALLIPVNVLERRLTELEQHREKQIIVYKENFKLNEDGFIKKWPTKNYLQAWYVKMFKQGYQGAHIHPPGWLSGVFYIKVPKLLNNNEGSIKFQFFGYDYVEDENLPNLIHSPKDFDLVLFPSSLFHKTIPFSNKDERHCIAFDLNPK